MPKPPDDPTPTTTPTSAERRLAELRFDLHDGPQQDVHLLAEDLRLFREQLTPLLRGQPGEDRVRGRLDDLDAQVAALDSALRRLSASLRSPHPAPAPLAEAVAALAEPFTRRTGIVPAVRIDAGLGPLSDAQQTAVLSLVREALSNIRRHAGARTVAVAIRAETGGVRVEIRDDGRGFDPERARSSAAGDEHLGLEGMRERVRMLGGRARIESRPGGPTVVSATLPQRPAGG